MPEVCTSVTLDKAETIKAIQDSARGAAGNKPGSTTSTEFIIRDSKGVVVSDHEVTGCIVKLKLT